MRDDFISHLIGHLFTTKLRQLYNGSLVALQFTLFGRFTVYIVQWLYSFHSPVASELTSYIGFSVFIFEWPYISYCLVALQFNMFIGFTSYIVQCRLMVGSVQSPENWLRQIDRARTDSSTRYYSFSRTNSIAPTGRKYPSGETQELAPTTNKVGSYVRR